jgi:hypothetical protein
MWRTFSTALFGLIALLGCSSSDGQEAASAATATDTATAADLRGLTGGDFQLTVHSVDDGCIDGGMDLLFMPEGGGQPYDLKNVTYIPGFGELPLTYQVKLQAPFEAMDVTMTDAGGNLMTIRDAAQPGVLLRVSGTEDCSVDLSLDADMTITGQDSLDGLVTVTVSNATSPTMSCSVFPEGCRVVLDLKGARRN